MIFALYISILCLGLMFTFNESNWVTAILMFSQGICFLIANETYEKLLNRIEKLEQINKKKEGV